MHANKELQDKAINAIRFLSVDAVQTANEGHPGLPMGVAAMAYTIWTRHLRHNPQNPAWFNRDRFVLSGGHGSTMWYSLLYLTGYDLPLEELKKYHVWGSKTPGHPEYGRTPGVEATTGPLGQGFANGVGMALAEAHMAAEFNRPGFDIIDHYTYVIVTDGDLMEGIASEAASLGGHLGLGKMIYLYDDNRICIEGSTDLTFTEDRGKRFEAYGWHVQYVADGNDVDAIDQAIVNAKKDKRPSIIICRTHIGFGFPHIQDTAKAHGGSPGDEELDAAKRNMGWPVSPRFYVPDDVLAYFRQSVTAGAELEAAWDKKFAEYKEAYPELAAELERRMAGELPKDWDKGLPDFPADEKGIAARIASGKTVNYLAGALPELIGGSADLSASTQTWMNDCKAFQADTPEGRNIYFGIREHAMGAIVNGMAYHKGLLPFGSTYLVFTDYFRGAIRLSALAGIHSLWVVTHDSIFVGGDGPTHQPVEQIAALRTIPGLVVIRPGDANETVAAWKVAVEHKSGPVMLVLSRQAIPTLDRKVYSPANMLSKGAYVLKDFGTGKPDIILMAAGSEVSLVVEAGKVLAGEGVAVRVVSFPSWDLFETQDAEYKRQVFPLEVRKRLAIEAGSTQGWDRWVGLDGAVIGVDKFGASASQKDLALHYGITVGHVLEEARQLLK